MNRLFDKTIVLACCLTAAAGLPVDAGLVAAACAAVALCAFAEAARGEGALRASEAAAFAYIAASILAAPVVPFSPLALYDVARGCSREHAWPLIAAGGAPGRLDRSACARGRLRGAAGGSCGALRTGDDPPFLKDH